MLRCDAVFEGGGVKGIGLVGAAAAIEKAGYVFENIAGTSAGAIVGALLAAGYTGAELQEIMSALDYNKFKQEDLMDRFSFLGKALSIGINYGVYKADYLEEWLYGLLLKKGKTLFKHIRSGDERELYRYRFQAIASDLTDRKLLVLPGALRELGFDPDEFSIARAVRMSMSIPVFYEPLCLKDAAGREHVIVDGGLLSNYPVWLLDDGTNAPPWPTFGFKFSSDARGGPNETDNAPVNNIIDYAKALATTMLDAHDKYHVSVDRKSTRLNSSHT